MQALYVSSSRWQLLRYRIGGLGTRRHFTAWFRNIIVNAGNVQNTIDPNDRLWIPQATTSVFLSVLNLVKPAVTFQISQDDCLHFLRTG